MTFLFVSFFKRCQLIQKAYLGPCKTCIMKLFCENNLTLKVVDYFCKNLCYRYKEAVTRGVL